ILCRESLSELTSAIAMSRCDNKIVTLRVLREAGLRVPAQQRAADGCDNRRFLDAHGTLVVKPARGEQGRGVTVGVREADELESAVSGAAAMCDDVVLEEYVEGQDLRVVLIDFEIVAAA